ncbi:MAG TPA: patatin-like phospholipase family protein, partial [Candidatus Krumholzibacteria bacterium]|nr:patatin-like phospholipase family protein [Candidatus Krumholzibacteria bacterium]
MGAVLGALYACGYTADQLDEMVRSQDWFSLFSDARLAPAQLQGGWRELPEAQLSLLLDRLPPLPPRNLSGGRKITQLIGSLSADALLYADNDFDRLPIPFRAVAVDLNSAQIVVLRSGSLARAVQASGTIPLLLPPIHMKGRELVDGGFRINNPVELARALGFRHSLVIDVSNTQLPDRKSPGDLYQMWIRTMELQEYPSNLVEPAPGEVVLHIPLQNYRSLNFGRIEEIVRTGYDFAAQRRDTLRSLRNPARHSANSQSSPTSAAQRVDDEQQVGPAQRVDDEQRVSPAQRVVSHPSIAETGPRIRVDDLELADGDGMGVAELRRRLGIEVGDELPLREVYRRFNSLEHSPAVQSAWIDVERVEGHASAATAAAPGGAPGTTSAAVPGGAPGTTSAAVPDSSPTAVRLRPHLELRHRPRLELAGHVITDDDAAILARLHQARLPLGGGEAALSYRYSERKAAGSFRLQQGIPPGGQFSLTTSLDWARDRPWLYQRGTRVDRLVIQEQGLGLQLGFHMRHPGIGLRVGLQRRRLLSYRESRLALNEAQGPQTLTGFTAELQSGGDAGLIHSRGPGFRLCYQRAVPEWGDLGFWRLEGGAVAEAKGPGRMRPTAALGFVQGSPRRAVGLQGRAGGPFGWLGLRREEILASRLLWLRGGMDWHLAATLRCGFAAAVGWRDELSLSHASPLAGVGTHLAWKTPLGPFRVYWAVAERRVGTIFVQLGPEF